MSAASTSSGARRPGVAPEDAVVLDLDPDDFALTRTVAAQLRDREQFLAGLDLILAGITRRSDR